jgi:nitrous oxide reductase accessory protein NosL
MSFSKLFFLFFLLSANLLAYPNYSDALKVKKIYPMGKKVFQKKCSSLRVDEYKSYDALVSAIETNLQCKNLKNSYKEALALYLWDVKREAKLEKKYPSLDVSHKEKCPICGMFLYKYPRWVSMIEYKDGKKFYFDGMKDLFKYYFNHKEDIKGIYTRAYYTQETIDAKDAYYVIGSDVYGPMGHELIGFKDEKAAKEFLFDHRGKKIVRFSDVSAAMIEKLDE